MQTRKSIFRPFARLEELNSFKNEGTYPYFRPIESYNGAHVVIRGKELIMAGSNNYLGLSLDPRVKDAAIRAVARYGTSCSGSRFMNGTLDLHEELESRLAAFIGKDAALCFTTGYQSNLGAISALLQRGDHVVSDKLNHASIMDGIFLAQGMNRSVNIHRFVHGSMEDLEAKLKAIPEDEPKLVATDGVFSMEGDIVDLPKMKALCDKYGAGLYLDEAHAIGVVGETGRGCTELFGSPDLADIVMCTFSKSFGSIGGFVAGDAEIIENIKHSARPLIFSASMPPANIAAVMAALDIIQEEPQRIRRLQDIGVKMIAGFKSLGFDIGITETPIIPLIIGDEEKTFKLWQSMFDRGVYVNPVVAPAVPPNKSLLRTSYMAIHSDADLDQVLTVAGEEGRRLGII